MGSEDVEISIHRESFVPSGRSSRIQHLSAATGLILTYLIEIGVQIFLTIQFWRSVNPLPLGVDWLWTVALSLIVSSLVVSSVSLIWVCHSLDFAGRLCGRLLCYVMHVFLLGIPWRYLKLAFAYDPADVQEFIALRIFQTYVQSLPLASIHLAALLTFQQNWTSVGVWLVGAESVSIVVALIVASYCRPLPVQGHSSTSSSVFSEKVSKRTKTTRCVQENLKCSTSSTSSGDESVLWCRVLKIELNILSRALLLICRVVTIALLLFMFKFWTGMFIVGHIFLTLLWIHLPSKSESWTLSRSLESSYVIFWDITSTLYGELKLITWAGPSVLVLLENGLVLTWAHCKFIETEWIVAATFVGLVVGFVLFGLLNLSRLTPWRTLFAGTRAQKINVPSSNTQSSIKDQGGEKVASVSNKTENQEFYTINKKRDCGKLVCQDACEKVNEKELVKRHDAATDDQVTCTNEVYRKNIQTYTSMSMKHSKPNLGQVETFVADTCCVDSNASSNSRNTNTLMEPTTLEEAEEDDLEETLESFVFCFPPGADRNTIPTGPEAELKAPEIKTASRVIMNIPKHMDRNKRRSRCPCHCQKNPMSPAEQSLIEAGSYGILFCEEALSTPGRFQEKIKSQSSTYPAQRHNRLRVLCAKCLQNHDPLLTDCQDDNDKLRLEQLQQPGISRRRIPSITLPSETTDYPSETEMTWTGAVDEEAESEVTSLRSSPSASAGGWTQRPMWSAMLTQSSKQFTSKEYVRTWLLSSQTLQRHRRHQQKFVQSVTKVRSLPYPLHRYGHKRTVITSPSFDSRERKTVDNYLQQQLCYKDLEIIV